MTSIADRLNIGFALIHKEASLAVHFFFMTVADPGVVPRVPGHHPKLWQI